MKVGQLAVFTSTAPARTSPGGPFVTKNGKQVAHHKGDTFKITKIAKAKNGGVYISGGQWWYYGTRVSPAPTKPTTPVPGYGCNYAFGVKDSGYAAGYHTGADFAAPTGAKIIAVTDGTITRTDWGGAYGNWTHLKSTNGRTYVYCHQSKRHVNVGDHVKAGEVIGEVGATGNVTGPHCHFECTRPGANWVYGQQVNPVGTW